MPFNLTAFRPLLMTSLSLEYAPSKLTAVTLAGTIVVNVDYVFDTEAAAQAVINNLNEASVSSTRRLELFGPTVRAR